ncbi:MAG: hypothetical protein M0003_17835 [Acidithiobacillus sp.]|nr:hypothetical protein [Acidithiobacillus sp.]
MPIPIETVARYVRDFLGVDVDSKNPKISYIAAISDSVGDARDILLKHHMKEILYSHTEHFGLHEYYPPFFLLPRGNSPIRDHLVFYEPSLDDPVSQICTWGQIQGDIFDRINFLLGQGDNCGRKQWEWCFIYRVLERLNFLRPGKRGLGFAVGQEPLPSAFVAAGCDILATDAPPEALSETGYLSSAEYLSCIDQINLQGLCDPQFLEEHLVFQPVDMNDIPNEMDNSFDYCWSSCAFEHLGSIEAGLSFVLNSLKTLRPGGIAIHTTEFNVSSNTSTFVSPELSIFTMEHIENLMVMAIKRGYEIEPLNFFPGSASEDLCYQTFPYSYNVPKLDIQGNICTSIGLVIRKVAEVINV